MLLDFTPLQMLWAFLLRSVAQVESILSPGLGRDVLEFLCATSVMVPIARRFKIAPVVCFLLVGVILGPWGLHVFTGSHNRALDLVDIGISFLFFEMGMELSMAKMYSMRLDIFVLGAAQFMATSGALAWLASTTLLPSLVPESLVVLGGALALSAPALTLQSIREKRQLGTRFGRTSFGVLLFQAVAIVPLLMAVPLAARGGANLPGFLGEAAARSFLVLALTFAAGHALLEPISRFAKTSRSPEAFLALTLSTVLLCSVTANSLGMPSALGAFFGGVLMSATRYRHEVKLHVLPFRGLLVGLLFTAIGFSLDLSLVLNSPAMFAQLIGGLLLVKVVITGLLCLLLRLPGTSALQTALLLAPSGELSIVVLGLAERLRVLPAPEVQVLVTACTLSMLLTPLLRRLGMALVRGFRVQKGFFSYEGKGAEASKLVWRARLSGQGFVVVCGYGHAGRTICQLLDATGDIEYIALENDPIKAMEGRLAGSPVFLADGSCPEVLEDFKVAEARLVIVAVDNAAAAQHLTGSILRHCPNVQVLVRAQDRQHRRHLLREFGLRTVVPEPSPDSVPLSMLLGEEALRGLGYQETVVETVLEEVHRNIYGESRVRQTPRVDRVLTELFSEHGKGTSSTIDAREVKDMLESLSVDVTDAEVAELVSEVDTGDTVITPPAFKRFVVSKLPKQDR